MSTPTDNGGNDLNRAFQHQVEDLPGSPLSLGDVQVRAKQIQRRRRITASVAAAAAVAIIAPIGLVLANNQPQGSGPTDRPTSAPPTTSESTSTDPTTSATTPSGPQTYDVNVNPPADGIYDGELPIPYWLDGALHVPGGDPIPIADSVQNAIQDPSNGQWAGVVQDEQANYNWTSYDDSGADLASSQSLSTNVAVTPDGSQYAYLTKEAPDEAGSKATWQLTLGGASSGAGWSLGSKDPKYPGTGPVGILSDGTVVFEFDAGKPMLARGSGIEPLPGKYVKAVDASTATDRIAVQTSYNDDGTSCWAVVDTAGKAEAQTCDYALNDFSADGRYVIGYDSRTDGPGPRSLSMLDARTLKPVATFAMPDMGFFAAPASWAGDSIVASAYQGGTWYVELLSVDGVQQVDGVAAKGEDFDPPPVRFAAGPLNVG